MPAKAFSLYKRSTTRKVTIDEILEAPRVVNVM